MNTHTERLLIRRLTTADAPFILELLNTPGWLQYIGDRQVKTLRNAEHYITNGPLKSYDKFGFGLYHIGLKDSNLPLGMCGLMKRELLEHVDLGFAFLPEHSGQGYALEAASAVLDHARQDLGITSVSAITLPENERSIRLLEKVGMQFEKKTRFPGEAEDLLLYRVIF